MKKVLALLSVSAILFLAACESNTTHEHGSNPEGATENVENTTVESNTTVVNPENSGTTVVDDPSATVTVTTPAGGATVQSEQPQN